MEVTNFSEMYSLDYDLKQLFAMNQKWSENQVFTMLDTPRQTSALVYYKNCAAAFTLANGEILYIKKEHKCSATFSNMFFFLLTIYVLIFFFF